MISVEGAIKLQEKINKMKEEKDKSAGKLEQLMETLKEDFDCDTLEELQCLLDTKKQKIETLSKKIEKKTKEFENKWEGKIPGIL